MVEKAEKASHLVVVGSSAGGIEALTTVLGSLPASFPAAVVLAQHVDPARPSYLGSILERKTALPVVLVGGSSRFVTLYVAPVQAEGGSVETVVVSILDTTDLVEMRRRVEEMQAEQRQLVDDLNATNTRLKHTNNAFQDANEELQGANEELLLAQEELQATNEEFEATNEEPQATNEELEATNEELAARTSDLQDLAHTLSGERGRLSDLVRTAPASVMVLRGADLKIETANTHADGFPGGMQVIGRTLADVCNTTGLRGVLEGARTAFQEDHRWVSGPISSHMDGGEKQIVFSAVPTHDATGQVSGVVLYGYQVI